jgi:SAM-dependent methyltransferase
MSFKDHFSRVAAQYSAFRPSYPPALFDYLAGLCAQRSRAWDCACGTGQATLGLAERFDSVIATDASPQQIEAATANPKITYRVTPAHSSGLDRDSVDLVTVAQALHWIDLTTFYVEVKRVLRSGGVFAVWTYAVLRVAGEDPVDSLIREFYHDVVGPYWPPERLHTENGYHNLPFPFPELTPPRFDMQVSWDRAHLTGYLRTWSATNRYVDRHGVDPVAALEEKLAPLWQESIPRVVTWPLTMRVGRE